VRDFLQAGALWSYNADAEYTTRVMRQVELLELWRYDVPQKEWKLLCALRELAPLVAPRAVRE
jgi:hypothetical protein